ncbi:Nod factor-specific ABC transporter NodJ protein [Desulfohalotomaculum tongense]|uniref:ABC transporter permease n=1 Tax=Desulforadius tongensis TaxID=1216062 RepID=UPI001956BE8D|nr:ABC transporter permease [Desulforadius tongensis]MBM7854891.1 Nod factor-specific ABC transporter NodJ protein [Desulforadius tongensis]
MSGFLAVLWREYLFFKRRFWTITTSSMVAPLLYLITFGWGLGRSVNLSGVDYINFLVPGIVALSTMNTSFNAIATPLSIARLYDKTLEEYMVAPITILSFAAGKIVAGAMRGIYAALIIITISFIFGARLEINVLFLALMFLNCLVFSSLGFLVALKIKSHPDMARFNNFVITPMIFICGTFFSLDRVPEIMRHVINVLPLTPASQGLRAVALGGEIPLWAPAVQIAYLLLFTGWGLYVCNRVE